MEKVRSNEGLAYGVNSDVGSDYYRRSTVSVSLQTKVETGAYAVKLVLAEMRRMAKDGITDAELQRAKDGLIKSLPAMFDTPAATARIFAQGEIWKRSPDHYKEYIETMNKMTKAEVECGLPQVLQPRLHAHRGGGPQGAIDEEGCAQPGRTIPTSAGCRELSLKDIEARK